MQAITRRLELPERINLTNQDPTKATHLRYMADRRCPSFLTLTGRDLRGQMYVSQSAARMLFDYRIVRPGRRASSRTEL